MINNRNQKYSSDFRNIADTYGGAMALRGDDENHQIMLRVLETISTETDQLSNRSPKLRHFLDKVEFAFTYSKNINAHAWATTSGSNIIITQGLVRYLEMIVLQLFAVKGLLKGFGEDQFERSLADGMPILAFQPESIPISPAQPETTTYRLPVTRQRNILAQICIEFALEFVFWHELGHCACGHSSFLKRTFGIDMVGEIGDVIQTVDALREASHAAEYQADLVGIVLAYQAASKGPADEIEKKLLLRSFSIDLMFWIFTQRAPLDNTSPTHPHPQVRSYYKWQFLTSLFSKDERGRLAFLAKALNFEIRNAFEVLGTPGAQWSWLDNHDVIYGECRTLYENHLKLERKLVEGDSVIVNSPSNLLKLICASRETRVPCNCLVRFCIMSSLPPISSPSGDRLRL